MPNPKPVFRIRNVPVYFPPSSALGLALISYFAFPTALELLGSESNTITVSALALAHAVILYLVIFVHELGHVFAAQHYQYPVKSITLHLIGGHTSFQNRFAQARHQFVVAVAGPLVTIVLGFLGWMIWAISDYAIVDSLAFWMMWGSFIGGILNLLPGYPLDGGAALSALVWFRTKDPVRGQKISAYGGLAVSGLWVSLPIFLGLAFNFQPSFTDFLLPWFLGVWMAFGAWSQLSLLNRIGSQSLATTSTWQLRVRRAISMAPSATATDALNQLSSLSADAVLLEENDEIVGIVQRDLLQDPSYAQIEVLKIARRVFPSDYISRFITQVEYELLTKSNPAQEWIVLDAAHRIYGVAYRNEQENNV